MAYDSQNVLNYPHGESEEFARLLVSASEAARSMSDEFVKWISDEIEGEHVPGLERIEDMTARIVLSSYMADVEPPDMFETGMLRVGFQWARPTGNCYLYTRLDKQTGEWAELQGGQRTYEEKLILKPHHSDWGVLVQNLTSSFFC